MSPSDTHVCEHCGASLEQDDLFCGDCGKSVTKDAPPPLPSKRKHESLPTGGPNRSATWLIAGGLLVVLVATGATAIVILNKSKEKDQVASNSRSQEADLSKNVNNDKDPPSEPRTKDKLDSPQRDLGKINDTKDRLQPSDRRPPGNIVDPKANDKPSDAVKVDPPSRTDSDNKPTQDRTDLIQPSNSEIERGNVKPEDPVDLDTLFSGSNNQALRKNALNNLKQIGPACHIYHQKHRCFPASISDLRTEILEMDTKEFENLIRHPITGTTLEYFCAQRKLSEIKEPKRTLLVAFPAEKGGQRCVLFVDGSTKCFNSEQEVLKGTVFPNQSSKPERPTDSSEVSPNSEVVGPSEVKPDG